MDGFLFVKSRLFLPSDKAIKQLAKDMISANPGVNPSLSITAISERAMSKIPPKTEVS